MKKTTIILYFILHVFFAFGQDSLTAEHKKAISDFVSCVKNNDRQAIAEKITFPFKREYPIPLIKNRAEFLKRYDEVFDAKLIKLIIKSDPSIDWFAVGYHGIMFLQGQLWLDYDGSLLAVNYQSAAETKIKQQLISEDKKGIHPSISKYVRPVHILKTDKYLIRIDDLNHANYRYAAWKASAKMTDKPDIIITNGVYVPDGSGGNHSYVFKKGKFTYECQIIILGEDDSPPANLIVYKGNKELLSQPATIILK